jgi:UDPglucose 6-dehydrogenase
MGFELKRVSVIGLGKLGAPLAACFAWKGFPTIGCEIDTAKVSAINQGVSPIYEPRLQDLILDSRGRLQATQDYEMAVTNSDVSFITVSTPTDPTGQFSLEYVLRAAEPIGKALRKKRDYHLVVLTSTVMPGSTEAQLKPALECFAEKTCARDFGLCYSPEFIALGSVIRDFLNPDFLLIGESDSTSGELLASLYKNVCENNPPVARMTPVNAELTKLALNTFITTKITFANMLARLCERLPGADVDVVTSALGLDGRIGSRYLKGAVGYGGPCFPRDNLALAALAQSLDAPAMLAQATDVFNRQQVQWLADLAKKYLPQRGRVGILGLAYKPNTDVVEASPGLLLAELLTREGVDVTLYDPAGMENARKTLSRDVSFAASASECAGEADVIVIATPWEEFKQLPSSVFTRRSSPRVVIDCWRVLDQKRVGPSGVYVPLGLGPEAKMGEKFLTQAARSFK